ncbi:MAG: adenylate/guanylate cyclase domain-containing protein [Chlorobiales bacterium]|nr:adenylate/guanylate cyclase domain-containing protein [Chlorobiales bacterium]
MSKFGDIFAPIITFIREKILRKIWFTAIFVAPVLVLISYALSQLGVFENVERKMLDNKFNARGPIDGFTEKSNVVIITVDDQSQATLGQFPWPRNYYAHIVRNLMNAGASVVAFDLLFSEPSKNPKEDKAFKETVASYNRVVLSGRTETGLTDETLVQYTSMDKLNLQNIFDGTPGSLTGIVYVRNDPDGVYRRYHPYSNELGRQLPSFAYAALKTHYASQDTIQKKGNQFSFVGRQFPSYDGESVLLNYYGPSRSFPTISASEVIDSRNFMTKEEHELFRQTMQEMDLDSLTLANDESLRQLWAIDVFDDPMSKLREKVKGKICIVGPMFPESKDLFPIPMYPGDRPDENQMYGVEIHATAVQNFLDNNFITRVDPVSKIATLLLLSYLIFGVSVAVKRYRIKNHYVLLGLSFIAALIMVTAGLWLLFYIAGLSGNDPAEFIGAQSFQMQLVLAATVLILTFLVDYYFKRTGSLIEFVTEIAAITVTIAVFLGVYQYTNYLFIKNRVLAPIMPFANTILLSYAASIFYQYFTESRQKKLIRNFFNVYVNRELVDQLIENPEQFRLGGEKRELTVLFSDIKGFTNISETMDPADLVILLNEYLGAMTEIVFKYGGTLDKYIGDAVMAFWGAPVPEEDHAKLCCWAALEMQEKLAELREKWKKEGRPDIYARIGINTGAMIVGNMGSESRFNYTVMGDAVNLAARLEPANKAFGTSIIVSEFTNEQVQDYCRTRELATITVQGKQKPIKIYELVDKKLPRVYYEPLPPAPTAGKDIMAIKKE